MIYQLCNTYASYFFLSYCMGLKISNLIASEIIRNEDINARVSAIEKWVAVADICRCLHNYNAVLEITSSMNRSAIFRLKKTWLKVSKQVRVGSWHHCLPGAGLGWATRVLSSGGHVGKGKGEGQHSLENLFSYITWDQVSGPRMWHWDPRDFNST